MSLVLLRPAALVTAIAVAAIVILHMIQSRWRRRVVPSLIIWRRVLARGPAVSARRPSVDLPLLLALAGAALLVLATAEPKLVSVGGGAGEVVIVIDNGTSSLTEDAPGPTRLAESLRLARRRLAGLPPGDRAALVATSPEPRVIAGLAGRDEVARALGRLAPVQVTGSLESAVALALAQGRGAGPVVVYTSRALGSGSLRAAPPRVEVIRVGAPSRNLAITHADFSNEEVFCALRSYAAREAEARLSLRAGVAAAAREIAGREVTVGAGGRAEVVFSPEGEALEVYRNARAVSLSLERAEDDLVADDTVWATRGPRRARRVGVVGRPSEPVARALRAARAETVALADDAALHDDVDLLVYSAAVPREWPPARPALLVAPESSTGPLRLTGEELRDVRAHLMAGAGGAELAGDFPPVEVHVKRARKARILARHEPLIVSDGEGEVLAAVVHGGGLAHVYLGFRPEDSDWPARASFPVFVHRLLESAARGAVRRSGFTFARVGESAGGHLRPGAATVFLPGGAERPREARLLAGGLYRVRPGGKREERGQDILAVNLLSETESDNRLGEAEEAGVRAPGAQEADSRAGVRVTARDLAGALAAAGLCLLAAEWIASARRT